VENVTLPDNQSFKPAAKLVSPALIASWRTWREMAGSRFAPSRKEIVPARFKQVLDSIFIMEVVAGGADFRFALGGQTLVRFMNGRRAGQLLSSLPSTPLYDGMRTMFALCVETAAPVARGPFRVVRDQFNSHKMEVLVLPLSDDGMAVNDLLGMTELKPESVC
jgi:hypothetical protein